MAEVLTSWDAPDHADVVHSWDDGEHSSEEYEPPGQKAKRYAKEAGRQVGLTVRAGAEALGSVPLMLGDAMTAVSGGGGRMDSAMKSLPGVDQTRDLSSPSKVFEYGLSELGLPEPKTGTERVVNSAAQGMAGAGAVAGAAGQAAKSAGPVASKVMAQLSESPGLQIASGATGGGAASLAHELGGGPVSQFLAGTAGGMLPGALVHVPTWYQRNSGKILREALKDTTPEEFEQAKKLVDEAKRQGIPLTGAEGFEGGSPVQQVASAVMASPSGGPTMQKFLKGRPDQVKEAVKAKVSKIGQDVGGQEAANQMEAAATGRIEQAQKFRTEQARPFYLGQRESDVDTINLQDKVPALGDELKGRLSSRDQAMQTAGQLYADTMQQRNLAKQAAAKGRGYVAIPPKDPRANTIGLDMAPNENRAAAERHMDRFREGVGATEEAQWTAKDRLAEATAVEQKLWAAQDELAKKNLPHIQGKVQGFLSKIDEDLRLMKGTAEGDVLESFRGEIAPGGKPMLLPSQLESIYKSNRNKLDLGLQPTDMQKTQAGVLKSYVKGLDGLIQEVSPGIKRGREVYASISKNVIDPLLKGPVGRVAGKGADAQKEASYQRVMSEFSGSTASPQRIRELAREIGRKDPDAFQNAARAYLEDKINTGMKDIQSGPNRMVGANIRNALEGTPRDADNLRAMLESVARLQGKKPGQVYRGYRKLLDVLKATGRIPGVGSQTQPRAEIGKMASESIAAGALDAASTHPTSAISNHIRNFVNRQAYRELAEMFTAPDSIEQMQKLAKLNAKDPQAQAIVAGMLQGALASKESADGAGDKEQ